MSNLISKELLSKVLDENVLEFVERLHPNTIEVNVQRYSYRQWIEINIYELVHLKLKKFAKLNNIFKEIDWSDEPENIFKKAEELWERILNDKSN